MKLEQQNQTNRQTVPLCARGTSSSWRELFCNRRTWRGTIDLSDAESAKWKEAIGPVIAQYIEKMNKKGFDGQKIVDYVKASLEKNQ